MFVTVQTIFSIFLEPLKPRPVMTLLFNEMVLLIMNHYYRDCI